jgi:hypothetical protein
MTVQANQFSIRDLEPAPNSQNPKSQRGNVPHLEDEADNGSPGLQEAGHLEALLLRQRLVPAAQAEVESALRWEIHVASHPATRAVTNQHRPATDSPYTVLPLPLLLHTRLDPDPLLNPTNTELVEEVQIRSSVREISVSGRIPEARRRFAARRNRDGKATPRAHLI